MKNNEKNEKLLLYSVSACIFFDSFMLTAISKDLHAVCINFHDFLCFEINILVPILPSFLAEEKIEKEYLSTAIGIILTRDPQTKMFSPFKTSDQWRESRYFRPDQESWSRTRKNCRTEMNQSQNNTDRLARQVLGPAICGSLILTAKPLVQLGTNYFVSFLISQVGYISVFICGTIVLGIALTS